MKEDMIEKIDWQYMRNVVMFVEKKVFMELYEEEFIDALVPWWMRRSHRVIETPKDGEPDENPNPDTNTVDDMTIEEEKCRVKYGGFLLKDIAILNNGNKFDKNKMTHVNPSVNFVSRTASNNGVSDFVDNNGTEPYKGGCMTLAFGGSIGSCFVQYNPFYTGQNVGVIDFGDDVSFGAKQYIATCLGKYCKTVFTAFADEINKHFKKDLSVTLPIKSDKS